MLNAPVIKFFVKSNRSPGVGTASDADNWELGGSAVANSAVSLFDGNTQLGTTTADSNGAWTFQAGFDGINSFTAMATDVAGNASPVSLLFNVASSAKESETRQDLLALAMLRSLSSLPSLAVADTPDHIINAAESTAVVFTVSGLAGGATGTVTFTDTSNQQVALKVDGNGTFSANLSGLTDGAITSVLSAADPNGLSTTAAGNTVSLDTDSALNPTLSVNAANPSNVVFTVSGLESDYSGTVTFTDAVGKSDVVPIGSNGTYSANLSNLTNGTLTYLMTVSDPAGNVINVDPTATLGDGSANAPAGAAQLPNLLSNYTVRPSWEVAGVDYAVGVPTGTALKDPASISMAGVSIHMGGAAGNYVEVTGSNVVLSGYDFSKEGGWQVDVLGSNATIENSYFLTQRTAQTAVYFETSATGGTVENNVFNGNNGTAPLVGGLPPIDIIGGGGTFNVEYNYIENVYSDGINIGGNSATETFNIEYNVIQNVGMGTDMAGHPDFLQTQTNSSGSGTVFSNLVFDYNTLVQTVAPPQGGTQGITLYDHTGSNPTFINPDVSYNTLVALPMTYTSTTEGVNPWITLEQGEVSGTGTVTNNYVDPSGNKGVNGATGQFLVTNDGVGSLNGTVTTSNNVNMLTGTQEAAQTFVSVSKVTSSPPTGTEYPGNTIALTLTFTGAVTVTGTPTLTLNDGGVGTYVGGSGTNALIFSYTVASTDHSVSALAITQVNLPNGATITGLGTAANLSNALVTLAGLSIDPPPSGPTVASITDSPATGDLNAGKTVTLTLNLSSAVTVAGGTPTLTLNDGGTATYTGGSGTSALTFSYTVGAADTNVATLSATTVNLNGATIKDGSGNAASLSLSGITQSGPQIDTTTPSVASVVASGTGITAGSGDLTTGSVVTLTLNLGEAVTVAGGTPTLTLNDGGTASYTSGSGSNALTFSYIVAAGQTTSDLAVTAVSLNGASVTNGAGTAANLAGAVTNPSGTLQIDTTTPTVSSVATSGTGITAGTGDLAVGSAVTLTVNLNEAVTVAGGTPTLTLNDGGTATYTGGSGTNALTFRYTVGAGQNTPDLAVSAVNLNGATVKNGAGTPANLAGAVTTPSGTLQIDTTAPTVSQVTASPGTGTELPGNTVTFTMAFSEAVSVTGTPTLSLNDGGTATYTSGSGTNALTFSYTVGANDSAVSALAITQANLPNGATIKDGAGNASNLSGAEITFSGLATDPPVHVNSLTDSPSTGDLDAGKTVTLTLNLSGAVTVAGGTPTLTLNDGGTATYTGGSGTSALTFSYTVGSSDTNVPSLAATAVNLNGATLKDSGGNAVSLSLTGLTQTGPQIDTTTPVISAIAETPANGDLNAGKVVTYSITMSEAVTVNTSGGKPTLTFNDGGTGTYVGGSGSNTLTFSYTVLAGQNTPDLTVSAFNLNGASITDGAGNSANVSLAGIAQGSPAIDTTPPTVASVTATAGDYNAGKALTLTLNMSEAVNVTGTPTLTLNDGGTATYVSGSGSSTLVFSYAVGSGQNTSALAVSGVTGAITDLAGNALSTSGLPQSVAGVVVDATTPTVSSVATSGTGITAGSGDLGTGSVVTLTVNLNEAVTVAGGTPTLTLNDGATATYSGGSGTSALTFSYTVAAGQNTPNLAVTAINLNGATVQDGAGNLANLSGAATKPAGKLKIDTRSQTVISTTASTNFVALGNNYALNSVGSTSIGPQLSYNGTLVTAGAFGGWTPIGAVQTATGYDIAWQVAGTNQYTIWSTDSSGNYVSNLAPVLAGNSTALESFETTFGQDLNGDGTIGVKPTLIQTDGMTSLVEYGTNYALDTVGSNTTGPLLKYNGSVVTAGTFGGWTPIGAVQTASGYDIAWQVAGTNQYTIWSTDSSGNYVSNLAQVLAGNSMALETFESIFGQDLNGDGTLGIPTTLIQTDGTTKLVEYGTNYALDTVGSNTTGPLLKYNGSVVTAGAFGSWTPIGAVQTASGYDVAWQVAGTNQYTIWSTDSSGNYVSNLAPVLAGNSTALETFETTFQQDINGDGTVGVKSTLIQTDGTTSLVEYGNNYALDAVGSSTTGPLLKYNGSVVTAGAFGGWTPIGAVQTATGYDIAWQVSGTNQYTIWSTDSSGNYVSNLAPVVAGNSSTLQSFETTFQQDLNRDGVITIPAGQTMELTGSYSGEIVFGGSTGSLKIDHAADFTGTIGGPLTPTDQIDFADINFNSATLGYSGNNSPGTLTVSDGTNTANLSVLGNHSLANFIASSDGHGGTIVVDPPLAGQGSSLDQQVALFSQYMASAFPAGGTAPSTLIDSSETGIGIAPYMASPSPSQQHASMLS